MSGLHERQESAARMVRARVISEHEERSRAGVYEEDDGEDWPVLSALFGGLALALILNTFLGLM